MRRLAALDPDEVITGDSIRAGLSEVEPGGGAAEAEPAATSAEAAAGLAGAVERHVRPLLAGWRDGGGSGDIYGEVLAEVERPLIQLTLAATRGNQIKAAAMLGLNRNTLRKKIRDLEISVVRGIA